MRKHILHAYINNCVVEVPVVVVVVLALGLGHTRSL